MDFYTQPLYWPHSHPYRGGDCVYAVCMGKECITAGLSLFNFSDLEEPTRKLRITDDSWLFQDEVDPILGPTASIPSAPQEELEQWWTANKPLISDRLVPFVRNLMLSENNPCQFFAESYAHSLECLSEGGAALERNLATQALESWTKQSSERAGRNPPTAVSFGEKIKCIHYVAQALSVGELHFTAVDMGEDIPLNLRLRQALGSENKFEVNQCVIKHLALSLEWWHNGKAFRIPARSRVDILASELRASEYMKALMCFLNTLRHLGHFWNMRSGHLYTMQ